MGAFVSKPLVTWSYDREGDVLYLSIGEARPAITHGEKNGLLIRTDPLTHEVVGLTILDYEAKFRQLSDYSWIPHELLTSEVAAFLKDHPPMA